MSSNMREKEDRVGILSGVGGKYVCVDRGGQSCSF